MWDLECDILVIYLSLKMSLTSKEEVDCGYWQANIDGLGDDSNPLMLVG